MSNPMGGVGGGDEWREVVLARERARARDFKRVEQRHCRRARWGHVRARR